MQQIGVIISGPISGMDIKIWNIIQKKNIKQPTQPTQS